MKKNTPYFFLITIVTISLFFFADHSRNADLQAAQSTDFSGTPTEFSLKESLAFFVQKLKLDGVNKGPVYIRSLTSDGESVHSGELGERHFWEVGMANVNQPDKIEVYRLLDGKLTFEYTIAVNSNKFRFLPLDFEIDSPRALEIALAYDRELKPGEFVSVGYNFALSMDAESGDQPVLMVSGLHQGLRARIGIDCVSGNVARAEIETFVGGGILHSSDGGNTWGASNLPSRVEKVTLHNNLDGVAYAVVSDENNLRHIYTTEDGGQNWARQYDLPKEIADKILSFDHHDGPGGGFLVGSVTDLYYSSDGLRWEVLKGAPEGPVQAIAAICNPKNCSWLLSAGSGLFQSSDLQTWSQIDTKYHRLSLSSDGSSLLATDPASQMAYLITNDTVKTISVPIGTLRAAGIFDNAEDTIFYSEVGGVMLADQKISDLAISAIAASPVFATNKQVIAAVFRSSIYKSEDAGKTWKVVCEDFGNLVEGGRDGISQIAYLSEENVIALRGGTLEWVNY